MTIKTKPEGAESISEECECGHHINDHEGSYDMRRAYCGGGLSESCNCRSWRPKAEDALKDIDDIGNFYGKKSHIASGYFERKALRIK